jgi:hypothetical protein
MVNPFVEMIRLLSGSRVRTPLARILPRVIGSIIWIVIF